MASGGTSFKGAFLYYMHDKDADTRERVAWTSVENMNTDSADKAWRVMAYTAGKQERLKEASGQSRAGRKLEKPVFAFSLAWHPEQSPDAGHMLEAARSALKKLGLEDHEAVIIAHEDEPQKHVHIVVNRVHPITGMAGDIRNSKRKLSDFAREYERENGKVYCDAREKNFERRQQGNESFYEDPVLAEAWKRSRNGSEFKELLDASGYALAQGRKRIVVVDPHGKIHNPARLLKNVKAADLRGRMSDLDLFALQDADQVAADIRERIKREQPGRDSANGDREVADRSDSRSEAEADRADEKAAEPELGPEASEGHGTGTEQESKPVPPKEKSAFEQLAEQQGQELRERHRMERQRHIEQLRARIVTSKHRLRAYHELEERKAKLLQLRRRIDEAPLWKRLCGFTRKDRVEMQSQLTTYRREVSQFRASVEHVREDCRRSLNEMGLRQELEKERFERSIERLREREDQPRDRLEIALARASERAASRQRDQGRER
ncbi:relaxase/mobilization nuclease domain-containing protein [Luteolibacter sp. Populi]|uniref:relaxase/mobilization nuclease domain-containing protein n=1 Tax=Luteolibacter sp. Populi TaxID=3230487 RepID=UPI003467CCED